MAFFSHDRGSIDIHDELAALRREVARLGGTVSKHGSAAMRDTGERTMELGSELAERAAAALPIIRRRAHDLEESIRDNPTRSAAVIGLAVLGVAAAVLLSSRRR
jgi:hypothetical protein